MTPRHIDLHGLTLAEAEVKVRAFIDEIQEEALADFEITLTDLGADPDELVAELARHRAELIAWREQAIAKMHGMAEHDGQSLN